MSQFNPSQYEFLFDSPGRTKPRLAKPSDAEFKKAIQSLIRKHGSIKDIPEAEAKKLVNRFQNHPLKRGTATKTGAAAKNFLKTAADKLNVPVAAAAPSGRRDVRGQMKLRDEYLKDRPAAATPRSDLARRQSTELQAKESLRKRKADQSNRQEIQRERAQSDLAKRERAAADRINERKARAKERGSTTNTKALARREATDLAKSETPDKPASKPAASAGRAASQGGPSNFHKGNLGKAGLLRNLAGGARAMAGGLPGMALLALSLLPMLGGSGKLASDERKKEVERLMLQERMKREMGRDRGNPIQRYEDRVYGDRLDSAMIGATRRESPVSPELVSLLGGEQGRLEALQNQMGRNQLSLDQVLRQL